MDSILTSVKHDLGIVEEYEHFDVDIIMYINSTLQILRQIGVGPEEGFSIKDKTAKWSDFVEDIPKNEMVKAYVSKRVKMMFDPPQNSQAVESNNKIIAELEWRINSLADYNT